jgi:hypothetical protein
MTIYPKDAKALPFPITGDFKKLIDASRESGGWIAVRGFIVYRDIFDDLWGNHFCFKYQTTVRVSGARFTGCPRYNGEAQIQPQPGYPGPEETRRKLAEPPPQR